jgi:hypothetical protein
MFPNDDAIVCLVAEAPARQLSAAAARCTFASRDPTITEHGSTNSNTLPVMHAFIIGTG